MAGQTPSVESANFGFLAGHDVQLMRLGALAERYFSDDPSTALIKLRQFAELLAQLVAAKTGQFTTPEEPQADLLRRLKFERVLPLEVADLFHQVRVVGNRATHGHGGDHAQALTTLKIALQLGVWYFRTFIDKAFKSGPFVRGSGSNRTESSIEPPRATLRAPAPCRKPRFSAANSGEAAQRWFRPSDVHQLVHLSSAG